MNAVNAVYIVQQNHKQFQNPVHVVELFVLNLPFYCIVLCMCPVSMIRSGTVTLLFFLFFS